MKLKLHVALTVTLLFFSQLMFAQSKTVTGTVTSSEDNLPLPGVSVVIEGTTKGTVTDLDGVFSIDVPDKDANLIFSYIGMTTQKVHVGEQAHFDVVLDAGVELDEFVVTALGISREKKSLGYAAQEVSGEQVQIVKNDNFVNNLSGKVSGVQIRTNNNLGGSTSIVIRGVTSLTGNNQALFVVDGIPMDNGNTTTGGTAQGSAGYDYGNAASDIDPSDIESINVLKGAAATALYGERASNGVVLITTKKGKEHVSGARKPLGVSFTTNATMGVIDRTTFPSYQKNYGGGYGPFYSGTENPGLFYFDINGDGEDDWVVPFTEDASYGTHFSPDLLVFQWDSFDPESPNFNKATPYLNSEHGAIDFFRNSSSFSNSLAFDGASENGSYRFSYTNLYQNGIMPNSNLDKNSVSLAGSYNLTKNVTISTNINYVNVKTKGRNSVGYSDNILSSFRQWWQVNVDLEDQEAAYNVSGRNLTWNPADYRTPDVPIFWNNPYWERNNNYQNDERNRVYGMAQLSWKFTDYLSLRVSTYLDTYTQLQEERKAVGSVAGRFGISRLDVQSGYSKFNKSFLEVNTEGILTYSDQITEGFSLTAFIGANIRRNHQQTTLASTNGGLIVPELYALTNSVNPSLQPLETDWIFGTNSFFASASFGFFKNHSLYIDATIRNDHSSTLPTENNSYWYPAFSGSWIFSTLIDADWLAFGKLRAGYSEVGKATTPYRVDKTYIINTAYAGNPLTSNPNTLNNNQIVPERTTSPEFGIDMQFFNENRLGFSLTYYITNSKNQIVPVQVSRATGFASKILNAGEIENKGWELTLTGAPVSNKNFRWDVAVNWSKNTNTVKALPEGVENLQLGSFQGGVSINATLGDAYGTIQGSDYVYAEGHEGESAFRVVLPSGYYARSTTFDNVIGNITPDWILGLNNRFSIKNWTIEFLIDVQKGGNVFSLDQWYGKGTGLYETTDFTNDLGNPVRNTLDEGGGVILEGVDQDGNPNTVRVTAEDFRLFGWARNPNSGFIYDAGYVKLRQFVVSYSLPANVLGDGFIRGATFSLVGSNLWIISKDLPDADPEAGTTASNLGQGWQSGVMPTTRNFGLTVNINF